MEDLEKKEQIPRHIKYSKTEPARNRKYEQMNDQL